jgi:hypothetical protein
LAEMQPQRPLALPSPSRQVEKRKFKSLASAPHTTRALITFRHHWGWCEHSRRNKPFDSPASICSTLPLHSRMNPACIHHYRPDRSRFIPAPQTHSQSRLARNWDSDCDATHAATRTTSRISSLRRSRNPRPQPAQGTFPSPSVAPREIAPKPHDQGMKWHHPSHAGTVSACGRPCAARPVAWGPTAARSWPIRPRVACTQIVGGEGCPSPFWTN